MEPTPTPFLLLPAAQEESRLPPASTLAPGAGGPPPAAPSGAPTPKTASDTQATTGTPAPVPGVGQRAPQQPNWMSALFPIALIFFFMWFFVIRPERKKQQKRKEMLSAISKGDKVVTLGGLHGEVVRLEDQIITIKVADGVRLKFDRNAVSRTASTPAEAASS